MKKIEYIREKLGEEELLCQLAEEAAELAQAALKLRRCITGKNPTPVTAMQAEANLVEELADVQLVAEVLDRGKRIQHKLDEISNRKTERWSKRIEEAKLESNFRVNEPLTLEELRSMIGEPVWVVDKIKGGSCRWAIVSESLLGLFAGYDAYRMKPREVQQ